MIASISIMQKKGKIHLMLRFIVQTYTGNFGAFIGYFKFSLST